MNQPGRLVRFATFEADLVARELRKNGSKIRLQDQPFQVLALLLENPEKAVTREELRQRLWSTDTFVDFDNGLNTAINKIREALGDSAENPRFVETLPRRGYRFIAPVQAVPVTETEIRAERPELVRKQIGWLAVWRLRLVAGAAFALLVIAIGDYFYFHRTLKLTEKDSIVLADFENTTGDPVFDGALRQGLSVQLEQTPFLQLVSDDQIGQTLRLMEKPPDTRLTPTIAREVCQRANATTEIEGSIAALGNQYVLGLNAFNCLTGERLAGVQVTANGKENVLAALTTAAFKLRSKLGESPASLERFDVPLEQLTTPSLEALRAWSIAVQATSKGDFPLGVSFLQRAVNIDPNFAVAYSILGLSYLLTGENDLAIEPITKGYELRDRTSELEKFAISSTYEAIVTGDMDKAVQICEQWTKLFPHYSGAFFALSNYDQGAGRLDESLAAALEVNRLSPPSPFTYWQVINLDIQLGRLDEARVVIQEAESIHVVSPSWFGQLLYALAFLHSDSTEMAKQVSGPPWPGAPTLADEAQSFTASYYGRLSRARDFGERAVASAKQQGAKNAATADWLNTALVEALFGNLPEARKAVKDAGNFMKNRDLEGEASEIWALTGDAAQAQKLADDLQRRFPKATYLRFGTLPAIRGTLAIRHGNPQRGAEELRAISSHELMIPVDQLAPPMVPVYVSGEAYLAAHRGAEAAAEFQMIVDHPGIVRNLPIGALAHLGLGRAYALQGDSGKARASYEDFFALWKDADADIPILKQAKAEYTRLQ
jgi:eukaryotic-like serine/threonine-protein kinase